jgi:hypothetical protein
MQKPLTFFAIAWLGVAEGALTLGYLLFGSLICIDGCSALGGPDAVLRGLVVAAVILVVALVVAIRLWTRPTRHPVGRAVGLCAVAVALFVRVAVLGTVLDPDNAVIFYLISGIPPVLLLCAWVPVVVRAVVSPDQTRSS